MNEVRDRVKKEMLVRLSQDYFDDYEKAMAVLAIPGLAIVDIDASLPKPCRNDKNGSFVDDSWQQACLDEQQNMLKAGYVKRVD